MHSSVGTLEQQVHGPEFPPLDDYQTGLAAFFLKEALLADAECRPQGVEGEISMQVSLALEQGVREIDAMAARWSARNSAHQLAILVEEQQ